METGRLLTMTETARRLGVSESTVSRLLAKGMLAGQRFGNRVWAIPEAEVERLRAEGRPKVGLPKGTKLSRRYEGVCIACGQPFQASRPARFCSPRCSARYRARERAAARKASR